MLIIARHLLRLLRGLVLSIFMTSNLHASSYQLESQKLANYMIVLIIFFLLVKLKSNDKTVKS